ncbi:MAG: hypothetical protein FWE67_11300 [Planctomycetaceae bacterium]|nr:hypothetical protein [Planctomycetaceae bacterium]
MRYIAVLFVLLHFVDGVLISSVLGKNVRMFNMKRDDLHLKDKNVKIEE